MNTEEKFTKLKRKSNNHTINFDGVFFNIEEKYEIYETSLIFFNLVGRGAYGIVVAARNKDSNNDKLAIKKIENIFEHSIFTKRCLRELKILRLLKHPNIIGINQILLPGSTNFNDIYVTYELMETDLSSVIGSDQILGDTVIKYLFYQLLKGIEYCHSLNIIHRDIKPRNILMNANCELKICDFGLARYLFQKDEANHLTQYIATRWYRPPEVLLSWTRYNKSVDIWSAGCILAEMLTRKPLFKGDTVEHQLSLIIEMLGTPSDELLYSLGLRNPSKTKKNFGFDNKVKKDFRKIFEGKDPTAISLLDKMLEFDHSKRITASDALSHPYFDELDLPVENKNDIKQISKGEFDFEIIRSDEQLIKRKMNNK